MLIYINTIFTADIDAPRERAEMNHLLHLLSWQLAKWKAVKCDVTGTLVEGIVWITKQSIL